MFSSTECPEPELIARFLDGDVASAERAALEHHLASCRKCYRLVTQSEAIRSRLQKENGRPASEGGPKK